jgi:hypothetical protein
MSRWGTSFVAVCSVLLAGVTASTNCLAKPQELQTNAAPTGSAGAVHDSRPADGVNLDTQDSKTRASSDGNALGLTFVNNILSDQKTIWTSPFHLHWDDAAWLLPLAETTGGFLATDPSTARALSNSPKRLSRYRDFSNYGVASMVGAGAGLYFWSHISHDEHQRETGILAGEAVIDSLAVTSAFQYSFGRERPFQDQGRGKFFSGGTSFPSDHAVVAWSTASVIAHEYPGPLTSLFAYGMATAVSASRVGGKEHFPSDVLVASAIGWLVGRQVYRTHHDPAIDGGGWENLSGQEDGESRRDRRDMASPSVPLDSWVYPALDRLAALGYVKTSIAGLKPWTRIECARLTEEASEALLDASSSSDDASNLEARLRQEFSYESGLLENGHNLTANLESIYTRTVSISGPPLTDSYHFGQTVAYDFGRPFERGTNLQEGGSFSVAAGPVAIYVRAEYQHAPSAPAPSPAVINIIALRDAVPAPPDVPVAQINRPELLDAYLTVNLHNWQLSIGRQSLDWGPGPGGAMLWNNNIEPANMVRLVNAEPYRLPGLLRYLGPARVDQFFTRLEGHTYNHRPFMIGQKINFKPLPSLEIGVGRTFEIGGNGPGAEPLTAKNLLYGLFGQVSSGNSPPGHSQSEMDWTFYVPRVRNYIVFYGDVYAADNFVPWQDPTRSPFRPGIYITRFPGIPKLDLHLEAVSTESPGFHNPGLAYLEGDGANHGDLNYWNDGYRDGATYRGFLIGNTVGRMGQAYQGWLTYWISPRNTLQVIYKNSHVDSAFITGGGAWQDYGVRSEIYLRSGFYLKSELQYEHISHYPILFHGPQRNVTAAIELGFSPVKEK